MTRQPTRRLTVTMRSDTAGATDARLAEVASLVGDRTRAAMLHALMDGRALTASELARVAGVSPQTASEHLARMVAASMISVSQQGRHRYHRLASTAVAHMIESIMQVAFHAPAQRDTLLTGPRDAAMRAARTCYDHLAGRLGVALAGALVEGGHVELTADAGVVTATGVTLFQEIGIDVATLAAGRGKTSRVLCRPCLDWSERRPHLAGMIGRALCARSLEAGWIRRITGTRAVVVTPPGRLVFEGVIGVRFDA
jgi:DNA-binding transcriptional ArsR family regulator